MNENEPDWEDYSVQHPFPAGRAKELRERLRMNKNEPTYEDVMKIVTTKAIVGDDKAIAAFDYEDFEIISAFLARLGEQPANDEQAKKDAINPDEFSNLHAGICREVAAFVDNKADPAWYARLAGSIIDKQIMPLLAARLSQPQPTTKPVAWRWQLRNGVYGMCGDSETAARHQFAEPLYASPPFPVTEGAIKLGEPEIDAIKSAIIALEERCMNGTANGLKAILAPSLTAQPERTEP